MSFSSNIRLLFYGLLFGILSALYPQLHRQFTTTITSYFSSSSYTIGPASLSWSNYHTFQSKIPIAANHDPSDEQGQLQEQFWRLNSKDGMKEAERMLRQEKQGIERRTKEAGAENAIGVGGLPIYFIQCRSPDIVDVPLSSSLHRTLLNMGTEIKEDLRPTSVILVTEDAHSEEIRINGSPVGPREMPASIAAHLELSKGSQVDAALRFVASSKKQQTLVGPILDSLKGVGIVCVEIPISPQISRGSEEWQTIGSNLRHLREQDIAFVVVGNAIPNNPPPGFYHMLHEALHIYSGDPRFMTLASLHSGSLGRKPTKSALNDFAAIYFALGVAGTGEGIILSQEKDKVQQCWRFGDLPLRRVGHGIVIDP